MRQLEDLLIKVKSFWPESRTPLARVAINLAPRRSSYGGGNQFVRQLSRYLTFHGFDVCFRLDKKVDCILIIDGRDNMTTFSMNDVLAFKQYHPSVICIHRINECDQRKQSGFMDDLIAKVNSLANYTVFVSHWLRDYHASRWFDIAKPHVVIRNGADPGVFHPIRNDSSLVSERFRLVTHHWSDNPMKGFPVYEEIDRLIAKGKWADLELWIIGRWPAGIQWKTARLFSPVNGSQLADLLRQCDAYVTASLWEPGAMHLIEGAQCGLPILYHMDGGGIVEVAESIGVGFKDNVAEAIDELRKRYAELQARVLNHVPSGDQMCMAYRQLMQSLLVTNKKIV